MGHTLGFAHEHSRPDRDEHIMINTTNIRTDGNFNREFKKFTLGIVPRLHVPYDMGSLMHYGGHVSNLLERGSNCKFLHNLDTFGSPQPILLLFR